MSWERRGKRAYVYGASRQGGRVVKAYLGSGAEAAAAAARQAERRAALKADAEAARALAAELGALDDLMLDLGRSGGRPGRGDPVGGRVPRAPRTVEETCRRKGLPT